MMPSPRQVGSRAERGMGVVWWWDVARWISVKRWGKEEWH